jgi:hypothetical protein
MCGRKIQSLCKNIPSTGDNIAGAVNILCRVDEGSIIGTGGYYTRLSATLEMGKVVPIPNFFF